MAIEGIDKLRELDFTKQLTFAYLTCERLYPNYVYFSQNYGFGNPNVIREAIDFVYDHLFAKNLDASKISALLEKVEKNTPDTGDFTTIFVSSALDTCTAVLDTLNFLVDKNFEKIVYISNYATDSVDMYIQEVDALDFNTDKEFQKKIDYHPLMQQEVAIQSGIITFLNKSTTIDYGDIQTLRHLQENNKKGSLHL